VDLVTSDATARRLALLVLLAPWAMAVDGGALAEPERPWLDPALQCPEAGHAPDGCWMVERRRWPVAKRPLIVAAAEQGREAVTLEVELMSSDERTTLARSERLTVTSVGWLSGLSIDTARYDVVRHQRAFGVRVETTSGGSGFTTTTTTLVLLLPKADRLEPLLELVVMHEELPIREGSESSDTSTLEVLPGRGPGPHDLEVTTVERRGDEEPRTVRRLLRWTGDAYREAAPAR
jgi:hypothetical protein